MRSYAFTVISHILGIVLSTGLLFYCVHEEIIFCPTFCGIAILYFSIHLYFIQMRQVKYWRYVVDCLRQQDLIQIVRSPYEDKVMRELADDLSAALRSLRGRLMDEEVRRLYFESLLNKVDTAVLVTDREGAIEWKNRAADALLDTRCRLPNEFLEAIKAGKTVGALRKTIRSARLGDRCHSYRLARLRALDRQLEEHPFYLGAE